MPRKRLTEEGVRKLKIRPPPAPQQVDYFDQGMPGLVLRASYGGTKTWRVLHYVRVGGKTKARTHKLGRYPTLNLKQARDEARKFLDNPQAALARTKVGTFKEVAEDFVRRHVDAQRLRSKPEIERVFERYIYPTWGERRFLDLKRGDVTSLLDDIEDNNGSRQADVVLAIVSKLMRWYQARHDDYVAPVVPGMRRTKAADRKRKRILDDDEIKAVWNSATGTFGALLKISLLTAQRREKVATMKWADLIDGEWRIPTAPREKANAGSLRLPPVALDIIDAQPRIAENPFVFAGRGTAAFNSFSQRKAEVDALLPEDTVPWTLHDLRRTARSLMSRAGVRSDIAERVLGHAIAGIEGVYDRHSYADEKADALARLAGVIQQIIGNETENVVSLVVRARITRNDN